MAKLDEIQRAVCVVGAIGGCFPGRSACRSQRSTVLNSTGSWAGRAVPSLALVHGSWGDHREWEPIAPALARRSESRQPRQHSWGENPCNRTFGGAILRRWSRGWGPGGGPSGKDRFKRLSPGLLMARSRQVRACATSPGSPEL